MKKIFLASLMMASALALAGCGQQSTSQKQSTHQSSTSQQQSSAPSQKEAAASSSSATKESHATTPWDKQKDQELTDFINQWAPTMGQSYVKYDGVNPLRTHPGLTYPDGFNVATVNDEKVSMGWAPTGEGPYNYNVVAMYNYDYSSHFAQHITYAFAFHDGQPVALVDEMTNGYPIFHPTKNADVANAFARIAAEQK